MIQKLRATPALAGLVIIASSASAFESDQRRSLSAGADAFVAKPLQMDELLHKIQRHLELTWRYEPHEGARAADGPGRDAHDDFAAEHPEARPPPAGELSALLEYARKGLIRRLGRARRAARARETRRATPCPPAAARRRRAGGAAPCSCTRARARGRPGPGR